MFFDGWQGIWRTALVGVLAYLAQIEAGVLSLDPEPLDLRDIVAGATLAVQPLIEQKGQQLFEPFWQLERASGGSGLGLAIVKGIVDLHKGRIQVISERGAGTTIRLSFPRGNGVQEASPIAVGALE